MLVSYVIPRAGTFSMLEKIRLLDFLTFLMQDSCKNIQLDDKTRGCIDRGYIGDPIFSVLVDDP